MSYSWILFLAYVGYLFIVSIVAFALFIKDKKMAQSGGGPVRIKEKTLLAACVFGGALGGFFGRIIAHHKTQKSYFTLTIIFSLLSELIVLGILLVLALV